MKNYTTGAVSVTKGSRIVTGKGTAWTSAPIEALDLFSVTGGKKHEIATVLGDELLSLSVPYEGATASNQGYAIALTLESQTLASISEKVEQGMEGGYSGNLSVIPEGMSARLGANAQSLVLGALTVDGSYQVDGELRVQNWPA